MGCCVGVVREIVGKMVEDVVSLEDRQRRRGGSLEERAWHETSGKARLPCMKPCTSLGIFVIHQGR